jgi:hypothetical protein
MFYCKNVQGRKPAIATSHFTNSHTTRRIAIILAHLPIRHLHDANVVIMSKGRQEALRHLHNANGAKKEATNLARGVELGGSDQHLHGGNTLRSLQQV